MLEGIGRDWPLINAEKQKKHKSYKDSGVLRVVSCEMVGDAT